MWKHGQATSNMGKIFLQVSFVDHCHLCSFTINYSLKDNSLLNTFSFLTRSDFERELDPVRLITVQLVSSR
jgi:hypothetical protein